MIILHNFDNNSFSILSQSQLEKLKNENMFEPKDVQTSVEYFEQDIISQDVKDQFKQIDVSKVTECLTIDSFGDVYIID